MPKNMSPERRRLRAKLAGLASGPNNDLTEVRRQYKALSAEEYIRDLVDSAPTLTDDQIARLRALLPPVDA